MAPKITTKSNGVPVGPGFPTHLPSINYHPKACSKLVYHAWYDSCYLGAVSTHYSGLVSSPDALQRCDTNA